MLKIQNVSVTPNNTTTNVQIKISVEVRENTWQNVLSTILNWQMIKNTLKNWMGLRDYM